MQEAKLMGFGPRPHYLGGRAEEGVGERRDVLRLTSSK